MNCQEQIFNLFAIYAVPKSISRQWLDYPWNVPYGPEVSSVTLAQLGFSAEGGTSAFDRFMSALRPLVCLTSYDGSANNPQRVIFCDESMTASAKPKRQAAGLMWDNAIKCTAIHPTRADVSDLVTLMRDPHDLVLVSAENDFFLLRTPDDGYLCEQTPNLSNSWRHDISWTVRNCHGLQLIHIS